MTAFAPELESYGLFKVATRPATAGIEVKSEDVGSSVVLASDAASQLPGPPQDAPGAKRRKGISASPSATAGCLCSGMCGSKLCDYRRNRRFRHGDVGGCVEPTGSGHNYCVFCLCEVAGCKCPRFRSRWCKRHVEEYKDDGDSRIYSNAFFAREPLPGKWPLELQVTAKLSYAVKLMVPEDFSVLLRWAPAQLTSRFMVAAFLAHSIKWPLGVLTFMKAVGPWVEPAMAGSDAAIGGEPAAASKGEPATGGESTRNPAMARAFVKAYREAILAHNGLRLKTSFDRMNNGLMHAQTGAAVQGSELGIVSSDEGHNRLGFGTATAVTLGPALKQYLLAAPESPAEDGATALVQALLAASEDADIRWPTGHEKGDILGFCTAVLSLAKKFRSIRHGKLGFRGGMDKAHEYKVKSFTRVLMAMCSMRQPNCFAELQFSDILNFCPDERSYADVLSGLRVGDVEHMVGVEVLMVSCWTCLFGALRASGRLKDLLSFSSSQILRLLTDDQLKQLILPPGERFPMGPRALAKALFGDE